MFAAGTGAGAGLQAMIDAAIMGEASVVEIDQARHLGCRYRMGGPDRGPQLFSDRYWIALDGELFDDDGVMPRPLELLANLYAAGEFERLCDQNGSYAGIIFDRHAAELTLFADRFSTRPLYFYAGGGNIFVASRIAYLLAERRVPRRLSKAGLIQLLTHQRTFAHHTIYDGIEGLSGGEMVKVSGGRVTRRQVCRAAWTGRNNNQVQIVDDLAERVRTAVNRRFSDDRRHGLLMSGGLDSRMVLAAAGEQAKSVHCVTVCPMENTETKVARQAAGTVDAQFTLLKSAPKKFAELVPLGAELGDGVMPQAPSLVGSFPEIGSEIDVASSGHFLDVMFRGTYQPKAYIGLISGRAALPRHRPIQVGNAETLADEHHIRTEIHLLEPVLADHLRPEWRSLQVDGLAAALALADYDDPYDAFDIFCMHAQGRHHSNVDFLGLNRWADYRIPAFDRDLANLYLDVPAAVRVGQGVALKAMARLSPSLFALPDAGTGRRATLPPNARVRSAITKAALRRLGLNKRPPFPEPYLTDGSWVDLTVWMRADPDIRQRLEALPRSDRLAGSNMFNPAGLAQLVEGHLSGKIAATKLLLVLLTLDAWLEQFPSDAADG